MKRYVEGQDRSQVTLFPESLDEYIAEDDPVRVVDVFVDELDLKDLGFEGAGLGATGRPVYHPATLLKIYIYGSPDFKTIADFRKDSDAAIRCVGREFVLLRSSLNPLLRIAAALVLRREHLRAL
jgi:transposase